MKLNLPPADGCFALLDDAQSTSQRRSRLYTQLSSCIHLRAGDPVAPFFAALDAALAAGHEAVALFDYALGAALQGLPLRSAGEGVLATVYLFDHCQLLDAAGAADWLAQRAAGSSHALTPPAAALDLPEFAAAVDAIHRYIESGDSYQVNLTFPLRFDVIGDPVALYAALRARQPVPYGALLSLPDGCSVLSLSPELFIRHAGGKLQCRPMKGTAPASGDAGRDAAAAEALQQGVKERAENLMIVDLLRNDLGRIARTGSVRVPALFSVERFGEVLQMTSTIEAELRDNVTLAGLFEALYPCGSITGAPKRRTMQIIDELERWPRGLYTGAIGWFAPPSAAGRPADFTLSVPIRTLLLQPPDGNDRRHAELGVGAGIVIDSDAAAEYQECLLKARFLTGAAPGFALFETLHASREGCRHLERHLQRLQASAAHFGFAYDDAALRARLRHDCAALPAGQPHRLRLALRHDGTIDTQCAPLSPLGPTVRVLLADTVMPAGDPLLAHKTTLRRAYDAGWRQAEACGAFDALFFNDRGELTEGGRSNVFVRIDGRWMTPPLSAGLLPGVMRALLLEDPAWAATERSLTREDLRNAEEVCVCNALRGPMQAEIVWPS